MENTQQLVEILTQQTELLKSIYAAELFVIGCGAAILVCVLLYKAIKIFY